MFNNPFYISDVSIHTMGYYLYPYIDMKIHQIIKNQKFNNIFVLGKYNRYNSIIFSNEKTNKLTNWKRPTAIADGKDIIVNCFPGVDYVKHYASIIATYLSLNNRNPKIVLYKTPSEEEIKQGLLDAGLKHVNIYPTVIIGKIDYLLKNYDISSLNQTDGYIWANDSNFNVTFLGCKFSFWGDIIGSLTDLLSESNVKRVMLIGKVGSLNDGYAPNQKLCTGHISNLNGNHIIWENRLESLVNDEFNIAIGRHITLHSVIDETKEWFLSKRDFYDLVDPEVGHVAKHSIDNGIEFSYLNIISDNLSKIYSEGLFNERNYSVLKKRKKLHGIINRIVNKWIKLN